MSQKILLTKTSNTYLFITLILVFISIPKLIENKSLSEIKEKTEIISSHKFYLTSKIFFLFLIQQFYSKILITKKL